MANEGDTSSCKSQMQRTRTRRKAQKVKTGCFTCKERRVKCDEAKPCCRRCDKFGVDCGGYDTSDTSHVSKNCRNKTINPPKILPKTSALLQNPYNPGTHVSIDPEERRYFYLFRQDSAKMLSGYFHSNFWSQVIPLHGHNSIPVRHATIAVAALLKCLETSAKSPSPSDSQKRRDSQYQFAILQYSKAVTSLRRLLSTKGSHHRVTLITAILFISIELMQGDLSSAFNSMGGAFLVAVDTFARRTDYSGTSETALDNELLQIFVDLEGQSQLPLFYDLRNTQCRLPSILSLIPRIPLPVIPRQFTTISIAKSYFSLIIALINRLHSQSPHDLESNRTTADECESLLDEWEAAFSSLFQEAQNNAATIGANQAIMETYVPHYILASNYAMLKIISASSAGSCSETFYDTLTSYFQHIIDHSKIIVNAVSSQSLPKFAFEAGVIPPLHVTGTKCRDPKLRREAIQLLRKCTAQEGVWDGQGCAEVCEWVMTIEEAGGFDGLPSTKSTRRQNSSVTIPEWDRVKLSSVIASLHEKRGWAQCISVVPVLKGKHRVWETTSSW